MATRIPWSRPRGSDTIALLVHAPSSGSKKPSCQSSERDTEAHCASERQDPYVIHHHSRSVSLRQIQLEFCGLAFVGDKPKMRSAFVAEAPKWRVEFFAACKQMNKWRYCYSSGHHLPRYRLVQAAGASSVSRLSDTRGIFCALRNNHSESRYASA